jgi:hypothetical protein
MLVLNYNYMNVSRIYNVISLMIEIRIFSFITLCSFISTHSCQFRLKTLNDISSTMHFII